MKVLSSTPLTGEFHIDQESCDQIHAIVRKQVMDEIANGEVDMIDISKVIANSHDYITVTDALLHGLNDMLENHHYREIGDVNYVMSLAEEKALERLRLCRNILGLE